MTRGERTFIFNICVLVLNILIGTVIEVFIIFASAFILAGAPESIRQSAPVSVILPFLLLAGLLCAIAVSRLCIIRALDKFDLRDKLDPKLVTRYPPSKKS